MPHPKWTFARLIVAALCLCAIPMIGATPSLAQEATDVADEAEAQFDLGNEAYRKRDFLEALSHYFASNRLARNRNVLYNIARCYEQLERYVEAYRYYQLYAADETDPKTRDAIKKALERIRPNVALLQINSDPPGATVYLNRKDLGSYGTTPRELAVKPGEYEVILVRPGHEPLSQKAVSAEVGKANTVFGTLTRILGTLLVDGEPGGAQVRVEDPSGRVGGVVGKEMEVSPGTHKVEVSQNGYVPTEIEVTIEAESTTRVVVNLERQSGTVVVQSDEPDALILIDGRPVGFTPSVVDNLAAGEHEIIVQLSGFRSWSEKVILEPDDRVLVDAKLLISDEVEAASRRAESLQRAPASVSLISKREIEAFGYTNADDAARGSRGYYSSDDGTYVSPGLRGYSPFGQYGNRLLVQLDGHTLNDGWIGSSYIAYDLMTDINHLERIEIVRGPVSVLYGTGAFFGVMNLVTDDEQPPAPTARAGFSMVGDGALRARASASAPLGEDSAVSVSGGIIQGQGRPIFLPSYVGSTEEPDGTADDAGAFDAGMILGKVTLGDLTLHGYFNQRDKSIPTGAFETIFGDPRARTFDRRAFGEIKGKQQLSDSFSADAKLFYDYYAYEGDFPYDDDTGLTKEKFDGHSVGTEINTTLEFTERARFTLGSNVQHHFVNSAEGRYGDVAQTIYLDEDHPYTLISAYAQYNQEFGSIFAISAAGRFDGWLVSDLPKTDGEGKEDRFINSVNPRLAFILTPSENDTLKLMGGRAFRTPSIYELTYNDGGITQIPSPVIDNETIITGELEYSRRFLENFIATGSVYVNQISDLIEQTGEGNETDPLTYNNLTDPVWTLGGELELRREFRRGWMMALQYSWQRTTTDELLGDARITNSPTHLAGGRLAVPIFSRTLRLATRLNFDGGRIDRIGDETDYALLWDLVLSGEAQIVGLKYSAGVRNLLDWRYNYPVGEDVREVTLRQPGRYFVVDVSVGF